MRSGSPKWTHRFTGTTVRRSTNSVKGIFYVRPEAQTVGEERRWLVVISERGGSDKTCRRTELSLIIRLVGLMGRPVFECSLSSEFTEKENINQSVSTLSKTQDKIRTLSNKEKFKVLSTNGTL